MCLPNPAATPGTMWSPTGREESRPQRRSLFFRKPGAGLACFRQAFVRRLRCNAPTSLEAELRLRILPTAGEGEVGELRILSNGELKLRVARRSQCQRNLWRELLRQIFLKPLPAQAAKNVQPPMEQSGSLLDVSGLAQS